MSESAGGGGGGGGVNLHMIVIRGCAIILGTFFWVDPGFLSTFLGYSRIFGSHFFLVKFDFFKNNPDFLVLILIFIDEIVECFLQGSCFLFLHFDLTYSCRKEWQ